MDVDGVQCGDWGVAAGGNELDCGKRELTYSLTSRVLLLLFSFAMKLAWA